MFCAQAAHAELTWLNEREDRETGRDWADRNLNLTEVEQYYEVTYSLFIKETQSAESWLFSFLDFCFDQKQNDILSSDFMFGGCCLVLCLVLIACQSELETSKKAQLFVGLARFL